MEALDLPVAQRAVPDPPSLPVMVRGQVAANRQKSLDCLAAIDKHIAILNKLLWRTPEQFDMIDSLEGDKIILQEFLRLNNVHVAHTPAVAPSVRRPARAPAPAPVATPTPPATGTPVIREDESLHRSLAQRVYPEPVEPSEEVRFNAAAAPDAEVTPDAEMDPYAEAASNVEVYKIAQQLLYSNGGVVISDYGSVYSKTLLLELTRICDEENRAVLILNSVGTPTLEDVPFPADTEVHTVHSIGTYSNIHITSSVGTSLVIVRGDRFVIGCVENMAHTISSWHDADRHIILFVTAASTAPVQSIVAQADVPGGWGMTVRWDNGTWARGSARPTAPVLVKTPTTHSAAQRMAKAELATVISRYDEPQCMDLLVSLVTTCVWKTHTVVILNTQPLPSGARDRLPAQVDVYTILPDLAAVRTSAEIVILRGDAFLQQDLFEMQRTISAWNAAWKHVYLFVTAPQTDAAAQVMVTSIMSTKTTPSLVISWDAEMAQWA